MIRIGAVNYLNSKPLVHGLESRAVGCRVLYDLPSRLADSLAAGRLDVALIPVVEAFSDPTYRFVSDACVASEGPVKSVKVYFRTPPAQVRSIALDEGSRTSAALTRVLLKRRFGIEPELARLPIGLACDSVETDAVLLIGDRAMLPPDELFVETWDLASEWRAWTGLPFVFACWVARPDVDLSSVELALAASRDAGEQAFDEIAAECGPALGIRADSARDYLSNNLHFRISERERRSLARFRSECQSLGLLPAAVTSSETTD